MRGRRGRRGPYLDFTDAVHFDNCESYGLYKQGMGLRVVQNVNARGTIYSMWIILRKCEGGCEARLVRSREQIW